MEKTLLQQIREKEQDVAQQIEEVKATTEAAVTAAKTEAENLLCTADAEGKKAAGELYWEERGKNEARVAKLRQESGGDAKAVAAKGQKNIPRAADAIVRFVTME